MRARLISKKKMYKSDADADARVKEIKINKKEQNKKTHTHFGRLGRHMFGGLIFFMFFYFIAISWKKSFFAAFELWKKYKKSIPIKL